MSATFTGTDTFVIQTCCNCHMQFAMTEAFAKCRRTDKKDFYCPAGHPQRYIGESDRDKAQRLAGQLDIERSRHAGTTKQLDYQSRARKAVSTRLKKVTVRVGNGVCPCCNRSFSQLANHMASEHPHYAKENAE